MGRKTVALIVAIWVLPTSILVNHIVPDAYMDEIFHIPQAQKYCRGNFESWDPMITTPPGLYILSLAYTSTLYPIAWFLRNVSSLSELCSTSVLRSTNGVLAVICSILIHDIFIHLKPAISERRATLYTVATSLYPLHWFFTFLYYTDVASVASVLAMYLAALKKKYWTSSMFGALAVLMRQTNIIWMMFVAATLVIDYAETSSRENHVLGSVKKSVIRNDGQLNTSTLLNASLRRRRFKTVRDDKALISGDIDFQPMDTLGLFEEILAIFTKIWCLKWKILVTFGPFILIVLAFACFVIWNGSIVLGAKDAHTVSLHFAQLMYFGLVSAAVLAPSHFGKTNAILLYKSFSRNKIQSLFLWLMALTLGFASVHFFSISHPYLLADNRHYTFYIWRKVINAHWTTKYLLVPLYVYSWFSIITILGKLEKKIWILLFFFACAAVLVPAPLIEFRYYSIPIFFLFFHSRVDENISWLLMTTAYVVVDTFTMAMFLFHPFQWAHEPGTQRFIW